MMRDLITVVSYLFLLLLPFVDSINHFRLVDVRKGQNNETSNNDDDVLTLYITQRLDHYRLSDPRTFSQRYFQTRRYENDDHKHDTTIALLCVGGEGPAMSTDVLVESVHCNDMIEQAKILKTNSYNVQVFALEHRYYGESYPDFGDESPVTNENLVYLSSKQALADLAHFVSAQTTFPNTKWVTFGGSYPGMMAAYARFRFPHLIHAAVSSSAPLQITLDFAAYKTHVGHDLLDETVGGSKACHSIVQNGHRIIGEILRRDPAERIVVAELFHVCEPSALDDPNNQQTFLGDGVIDIPAQSNDPSCDDDLCNIDKICRALIQQNKIGGSVRALAWVARQQQGDDGCMDVDYQGTLDYIADPIQGKEGGLRSWLWQTCTEFGYYQTCEQGCPFGQGYHHLDQDLELCEYAFGIPQATVAENVLETLNYYGGWKLQASRILSVNGDVDPWSELALQERNSTRLPTYIVKGASHHFWTHPVRDTDGPEIVKARRVIFETVQRWIRDGDVLEVS